MNDPAKRKRYDNNPLKPVILGLVRDAEKQGYLTSKAIQVAIRPFRHQPEFKEMLLNVFEFLLSFDIKIVMPGKVAFSGGIKCETGV